MKKDIAMYNFSLPSYSILIPEEGGIFILSLLEFGWSFFFLGVFIIVTFFYMKRKNGLQKAKGCSLLEQEQKEVCLLEEKTENYRNQIASFKENQKLENKSYLYDKNDLTFVESSSAEIKTQESLTDYQALFLKQFEQLFMSTSLSKRIPDFTRKKCCKVEELTDRQKDELINIMDKICLNFATRIMDIHHLNKKHVCICCLLKLGVTSGILLC